MIRSLPLVGLLLSLLACGAKQTVPCDCPALPTTAEPVTTADIAPDNECRLAENRNLHAVAWTQTAVEFDGVTVSVYRGAIRALQAGLSDGWLAAPEQTEAAEDLPAAVVLDLDETVLDNAPYQAWLMMSRQTYSDTTWEDWCDDGSATLIPGALEYLRAAQELGVAVFFITNRSTACEAATIANLNELGIDATADTVITRGEINTGSDKGARRAHVAQTHRIVQLVGDNLGDFVDGYNGTLEHREQIYVTHEDWWGRQWIVLPNPQYGSWPRSFDDGNAETCEIDDMGGSLNVWSGPVEE
jgi:5'-nucleotidase (lipoprotein e(P4) family)